MGIRRNIATAGAVTALVVGATTAFSATASAAPNVTPQGVCGSAYKTVNSVPVGSLGTVYLTYNSTNGKNCVATIRTSPGKVKAMSTYIYVPATDEYAGDNGNYTSYAYRPRLRQGLLRELGRQHRQRVRVGGELQLRFPEGAPDRRGPLTPTSTGRGFPCHLA